MASNPNIVALQNAQTTLSSWLAWLATTQETEVGYELTSLYVQAASNIITLQGTIIQLLTKYQQKGIT